MMRNSIGNEYIEMEKKSESYTKNPRKKFNILFIDAIYEVIIILILKVYYGNGLIKCLIALNICDIFKYKYNYYDYDSK
jgi:hypothetical protein